METYGQMEGRMDGPYFIGPFQLRLGVQKQWGNLFEHHFADLGHVSAQWIN